jgi:hypothetical protein
MVQTALPIIHAGHSHATGALASAGRVADSTQRTHGVLGAPSSGHDNAACVVCQTIGMTRSAMFQSALVGRSVDERSELATATDAGVARDGPRITSAAPRGPPARA